MNPSRGNSFLFATCCGILFLIATVAVICQGNLYGQENEQEIVTEHFAAAQQAQKQNDYDTAEREYKAVLEAAPKFAEAHMNLGLVYQLQNRIPEAMAQFHEALAIKPALAGANFFLGVDYCNSGEGAKAIGYLKAAAQQQPDRVDIWSWLATAQESIGDIATEIATLKHALTLQPGNVDLLYLLGHAYEKLGKAEVAGLQKAAPDSSWTQQLLGESYSASNQWSFAVIRFQNAIAAAVSRPGLHVGLGEVLLRAGRVKQAQQEFEEELRISPNSLRAKVRLAEVKLIQGDVDGALEGWSEAIRIDQPRAERILGIRESGFGEAAFEQLPDPLREKVNAAASQLHEKDSVAARFALAFIAAQAGNSSEAAGIQDESKDHQDLSRPCSGNAVREALKQERYTAMAPCMRRLVNPQSTLDFRLQIANALFESGDYETSLAVLSRLPAKDRLVPAVFYWRARSYEKLATAAYLRLFQADANSYRVHQLMGDLEAARGDDKKAIEEYRAAIALKPSVPNLHYSLGHLLWKNLQTAEARNEFETELKMNPQHVGALHDLGNTYLLEHQPEKALTYLNQVLKLDPGDPDLHRDLGTGYSELRDYRKAESEFKIAVSADRDGSVHYKLGRVYQALGEKEKAQREFEISTALNRESHSKLEKQTDRLNQIEGASSQ